VRILATENPALAERLNQYAEDQARAAGEPL